MESTALSRVDFEYYYEALKEHEKPHISRVFFLSSMIEKVNWTH